MSKRKLSSVDADGGNAESSAMAEMRSLLKQSLIRLQSMEDKMSKMQNEIDDLMKVNEVSIGH